MPRKSRGKSFTHVKGGRFHKDRGGAGRGFIAGRSTTPEVPVGELRSPSPCSSRGSCPSPGFNDTNDTNDFLDALDVSDGEPAFEDVNKCLSRQTVIEQTMTLIRAVLPKHWIVIASQDAFNIVKISLGSDPAIQRNVSISHNGSVRITVHRKPVSNDLYKILVADWSDIVLTSQSQKLYVDRALAIVLKVKHYEICCGADNEMFSEIWDGDSSGFLDSNPYDESRYTKTFRSSQCSLLVPVERWRCPECIKCNERLRVRFKTHLNEEAHRNTRNDYLDPQQLHSKLNKQQREIKKARSKIDYLKRVRNQLEQEGVTIEQDIGEHLLETLREVDLNPIQHLFLQQQVESSMLKDARGMRWHPSMIRFALMLRCSAGASGYDAIRQSGVIKLPGERTLFDYTHAVPREIGIFAEKLNGIHESNATHEEEYQNFYNLLVDEIHIAQKLVYRKSDGSLVGYVALTEVEQELKLLEEKVNGTKSEPETAKCILAYMIKGVSNSVKELVAAFPVKTLKREDLFERSWQVISSCEVRNLKILSVICDGCAVNRAFINMHTPATVLSNHPGLVFDTINMCAPDRKLFFISDPPHLMKTIRNCFAKSGKGKKCTRLLTKNKQFIVWKSIEKLYLSEVNNTLRRCYKLTSQNVYLNSYTCMKVNYAVQVLSNTVGEDLKDRNWPGTEETADFILNCDKFFDNLNGAHTSMGKRTENPRLAPYTSTSDCRFDELRGFEKYLLDWEDEVKANPKLSSSAKEKCLLSRQTLEGIYITVNAFIGAVTFMLGVGSKFINARCFCQDPLEQYFSKQRAAGGGKSNPTVVSFLNAENRISIHRDLNVKRRSGNTDGGSKMMEASDEPLPKRRTR